MKIVLAYNLKPPTAIGEMYAEWDEPATIEAVRNALACEHDVVLLEERMVAEAYLLAMQPDMVFNLVEGLQGAWREARLPALLERLGIPFTGSSSHTLYQCLNKAVTKRVLLQYGLPTPDFAIMIAPDQSCDLSHFPLLVKPLHEGSSKGIWEDSVVWNMAKLRDRVAYIVATYDQPALVEAFLPGREFTVALLGNGKEVLALPLVEIQFMALHRQTVPLYSYEAKWLWDTPDKPLDIFMCPAEVDPTLARAIVDTCVQAFHALNCRDWCRIDLRLDATGQPSILEMNPLPGILPGGKAHSCFPYAAAVAGMTYDGLIQRVLEIACRRYGRDY